MWRYTGVKECNEYLLSLFLFDCNDSKKYIKTLYSLSNNTNHEYRMFKIKKRNGKYRTIYEPSPLLKKVQRNILKKVLSERTISSYAKAYRKGVSLRDNASCHVGKKKLLKLDIKNFFDSISFMDVYESCFMDYYPKSVGMLFTYLCTYQDHLVQGAPTSSMISNLVMKDFDEEIGSYCKERNISYTRYSDDMTFSGDFDIKEVIHLVRKRLYKMGLLLNDSKTCVVYSYQNQNVTGITVNQKVQVNSKYRKKIRQEMYYYQKYGECNDIDSLRGRVQYVLQINPEDREFLMYRECLSNQKGAC